MEEEEEEEEVWDPEGGSEEDSEEVLGVRWASPASSAGSLSSRLGDSDSDEEPLLAASLGRGSGPLPRGSLQRLPSMPDPRAMENVLKDSKHRGDKAQRTKFFTWSLVYPLFAMACSFFWSWVYLSGANELGEDTPESLYSPWWSTLLVFCYSTLCSVDFSWGPDKLRLFCWKQRSPQRMSQLQRLVRIAVACIVFLLFFFTWVAQLTLRKALLAGYWNLGGMPLPVLFVLVTELKYRVSRDSEDRVRPHMPSPSLMLGRLEEEDDRAFDVSGAVVEWYNTGHCPSVPEAIKKVARVLGYVLLAAVLALHFLYCIQAFTIAVDFRDHPAPGRLLGVPGVEQLHLWCEGPLPAPGSNSSTVVIDSDLKMVSIYWKQILYGLRNRSRVCVVDRGGYAWSSSGFLPRNSATIAAELQDLLRESGEPGPYYLVGHGFGGFNVRIFASENPEVVSGVCLIDAYHEDMYRKEWRALGIGVSAGFNQYDDALDKWRAYRVFEPIGAWRYACRKEFVNKLPLNKDGKDAFYRLTTQNRWVTAILSEAYEVPRKSADDVRVSRGGGFGQLPVLVLTAGVSVNGSCAQVGLKAGSAACAEYGQRRAVLGPLWLSLQRDLSTLSSQATWEVLWNIPHDMPITHPSLVVRQVLQGLEAANRFYFRATPIP